jgi:PAS domain S-box-containing protein
MFVDLDGRFLSVNAAVEGILGTGGGKLAGGALSSRIHKKDLKLFISSFKKLASGKIENLALDMRLLKEDQSPVWIHLSMSPVVRGGSTFIFGIVEDVTASMQIHEDLKRSKELAEESTRVKSEFIANMSHEIRTPIHTIIGMGELLSETNLDAEQKEYNSQIQFAADVLLSLVDNILDFSKIEAGRLTLDIIDFDLAAMAEEALNLVSLEAHTKTLEIIAHIDPRVPRIVQGDPHRIRQIIINLVKNAVKFTHSGEICLSVTPMSRKARRFTLKFAVADTGIGIPEEKKDLLFRSFAQIDTSMTRKFGGTGLGLTISKDLVELMGGRIGFESEVGKGSTFWFILPLAVSERSREAVVATDSLRGIRVLIVDDSRRVRTVIGDYLTAWGCVPTMTKDGSEALLKLRRAAQSNKSIDIALIDARLPGIDGWQLAGKISADTSLNSTRLILLTPVGKSGDEAKMKLLRWFDGYLNKPVRYSQLRDMLIRTAAQELDLVPAEVEEIVEEATPSEESVSARILVAEDHVVNQTIFRAILEKLGHQVAVANDGQEAVVLAKKDPADLIFMDVHMPNMNGLEATRVLRKSGNKVPIIAVTAMAMKEAMQECVAAGMNDYLTKPFKKDDLLSVLQKWLPGNPGDLSETESSTPDSAASQIFDLSGAVHTFLGKREVVIDLLRTFIAKTQGDITEMGEALAEGNLAAIGILAHGIKGGAWNIEARRLGDAAEELEKAAVRGESEESERQMNRLNLAFEEFHGHVRREFELPSA